MLKHVLFLLILIVCGETVFLRGTRANEGQFPWLIQFQTVIPCGGVLVSPDWVLTAAQCVQHKRNSIIVYAAGINDKGSAQTMSVKATYIFPRYEPYSTICDHENNIALLKLIQPFDICDKKVSLWNIVPVKLDAYKSCLIFGWQSFVSPSNRVLAKPIHYNEVILNSWRMCMNKFRQQNATFANTFCAMVEVENGMESCAGNPGSPVTCEDEYNRTILVGIASWTNFSLSCGGFTPYVGVSPFRDWMCNLILNDKDIGQQDSGTDFKSMFCKRKQYLGDLIDRIHSGNTSDIAANIHKSIISFGDKGISLQQSSHAVTDSRSIIGSYSKEQTGSSTFPKFQKKIRPHDIIHDDYETLRIPQEYHNTIVIGTIKNAQSNLIQYQEIGPSFYTDKPVEVTDASTQKQRQEDSNKCLPSKDRMEIKFTMPLENSMDSNAELLLPFYFEATNSSITGSFIDSYYFIIAYFICLCYLYNIYIL